MSNHLSSKKPDSATMLSLIVAFITQGVWSQKAMLGVDSETFPPVEDASPRMALSKLDFPEPIGPTIVVRDPDCVCEKDILMLLNTFFSFHEKSPSEMKIRSPSSVYRSSGRSSILLLRDPASSLFFGTPSCGLICRLSILSSSSRNSWIRLKQPSAA